MSGRGQSQKPKQAAKPAGQKGQPQKSNPPKPTPPQGRGVGRGATGSFHNVAHAGGIGRGTPIQRHFQVDPKSKTNLDRLQQDVHKFKKQEGELEIQIRQTAEQLQSKQDNIVFFKRDLEELESKKEKAENPKPIEKTISTVQSELHSTTSAITKLEGDLAKQKKSLEELKAKVISSEQEAEAEKKKIETEREQFYAAFNVPATVDSTPAPTTVTASPKLQSEIEDCDKLIQVLSKQLGLNKKEKQPKAKKEKKETGDKDQEPKKEEATETPSNNEESAEPVKETKSEEPVVEETKVEESKPEAAPESTQEPEREEPKETNVEGTAGEGAKPAEASEEKLVAEPEEAKSVTEESKPEAPKENADGEKKETGEPKKPKEKKPPVPLELQLLPAYQPAIVLLFETLSCIVPKNKAEATQVKEILEKRKEYYLTLRESFKEQ